MDSSKAMLGHVAAELRALNSCFATIVFGSDRRILRANNAFLRMFGYELDEIVGREESMFAPPDEDSSPARTRGKARLRSGQKRTVTAHRVRKDGTSLWVEALYTAITDPAGRVVETVAIVSDVSAQQIQSSDDRGQVEAINRSQAVVQFSLDGTILHANEIFLTAMGYRLDEIVGRHHAVFVEPEEAASEAYATFWSGLAEGVHQAAEYRRIGKDGRHVWLQATYNPILDPAGRPVKIVKLAVDVTQEKLRKAEYQWQIAAIEKSHAVIRFDMNGTILHANDRFLEATGYALDEIKGRHHRMFVDASHAHSAEYAGFWRDLKQGHHRSGQYKRIGRNGREIWLQASYNPIFDMSGRPVSVVKYATIVTEAKLQQAEYEGQISAINTSQCVIALTMDGTILDANDNFLDTTGYRYIDVLGKDHRMFVEDAVAESDAYAEFWTALAQGRHQAGEYKRIGKDGREIWLQATYNPIFDLNGHPFKVIQYAADISAEKLRQAEVEGQIEAINKSQGVLAMALDGTILEANDNFLRMFGYELGDIQGHHHRVLVEADFARSPGYAAFWERLGSGEFHSGLYKRIGRNGEAVWLQASYNPILDLNGKPFKVVKYATDVTSNVAMAEAFEDAKRQAQHDPATSLPNRTRLASFMSSALPHPSARLVVLYIDLDRFKPVNDVFGHPVGDMVLGTVADRLRRLLKDDQIAARVGGDEFVIAAPDLSDEAIEALCQSVLDAAATPIRYEETDIRISASVGVAISPGDGVTPDELLRCADVALYRAKQEGRGTYCFHSAAKNERVMARRNLADDMRRGISAGEFFLEYQPRFDTRSRTIRSVEALVRWAHPERGRLPPLDFIPLAERNGLIVPLGTWILETACRTVAAMPGIGVSVNVSPLQFRDDALVGIVEAALAASGLEGSRLELEITESALIDDKIRVRGILDRLKALGVQLAMDDFGTGYSSMSYLCDLPFDVIKIDRRFISEIDNPAGGRAIVQAILGLGRSLGLSVTAEGVETYGQLAMLSHDRCQEVQGFLLARPMSDALLAELLANADHAPALADEAGMPSSELRPDRPRPGAGRLAQGSAR